MFRPLHRVLFCLILCLCVSTLPCVAFSRQISSTRKPAPQTVPVFVDFNNKQTKNLTIMRGDRLQFIGDCSTYSGGLTLWLNAHGTDIATTRTSYAGKFVMEWNSAPDHFFGLYLRLLASHGGLKGTELVTLNITIRDTPAFSVDFASVSKAKGHYTLRIKPAPSKNEPALAADSYDIYCDEKPLGQNVESSGEGEIDVSSQPPGKHAICVKAKLHDGSEMEISRFTADVPARVTLELDSPSNTLDLRHAPPLLPLVVTPDDDIIPVSGEILLDGHSNPISVANLKEMKVSISGVSSGPHRVTVVLATKDGQRVQSTEVAFKILRDSSAEYHIWKDKFNAYNGKQKAEAKAISDMLTFRYEGKLQAQNSVDKLVALLQRTETTEAEISALDWPVTLEQEDQRTLEKARKNLISSFRTTRDTARALQAKLRDLDQFYDGTIANVPLKFHWGDFVVRQTENMISAKSDADSSMEWLALVERRGNVK